VSVLLVAALGPAAQAAPLDEDDPKLARGESRPPLRVVIPAEDDPKLTLLGQPRSAWRIDHPVPRFKLGYRRLVAAALQGGDLVFNAAVLDYYPSSSHLRLGLSCEIGIAGGTYGAWYVTQGAAVGFQWPWRVTPFVETRVAAGLLGGDVAGKSAVSYIWTVGVEGGVELYYASRFYVSAAIGWAHPVYSGIDIVALAQHPMLEPPRKDFAADSFTFKIGLGF
jgi:hypothetical protein